MSSHKTERLIDLIALLLSRKTPVTRARIKKLRPEYQTASEATFDRMFARDKKELLSIGVPVKLYHIETDQELTSPAGIAKCKPEEIGYLIDSSEYFLPQLDLENDEWLALRAIGSSTARAKDPSDLNSVWRKLECQLPKSARDARPELAQAPGRRRDARADLKNLPRLMDAVLQHRQLELTYHAIGNDHPGQRTVKPYYLVYHTGVWYLLAFCLLRNELRVFKVSRIDKLKPAGKKDSFNVPEDINPGDYIGPKAWEMPGGQEQTVELEIFSGQAWIIRGELGEKARWKGDKSVLVTVRNSEPFVRWAAANWDRVKIISPRELAERVETQVRQVRGMYSSSVIKNS